MQWQLETTISDALLHMHEFVRYDLTLFRQRQGIVPRRHNDHVTESNCGCTTAWRTPTERSRETIAVTDIHAMR